ncbi:MAG: aspartate kinase [Porticoccaceae bacterium]|jgi:aspartate kinase|nr:aspartate kinase [Porticoccaceae bacterium]MEA3300829.1 aspartate kinase [Pseudomonadota bacterium]HLS99256.1 aspartate kinase [Porticoccaceae bacterium]
MKQHTVEKIGGTSMSNYRAVRDNIVRRGCGSDDLYQRIMVVSAYGGITNLLLEHKKTGQPGVYGLFANANDDNWQVALDELEEKLRAINGELFSDPGLCRRANQFIDERLAETRSCLTDLERVCQHGHFALEAHLKTVREMLASIGETHSAWNLTQLLRQEGINARFVDLTGWNTDKHLSLDDRIREAFARIDLATELPIVTGYAHSKDGLMSTFDRGYSEMTFSRVAVLTGAREAIIHKEYHLSSADPLLVGADNAVPIGRTNYDVADQLANLGMEAIHPKAAKGLRQNGIALRIMNTFEPEHAGTLVTSDYVSGTPRVEIIAGARNIYAIECFEQNMAGEIDQYDRDILAIIARFKGQIVTKDITANSITHYLGTNLKTAKRIRGEIETLHPESHIQVRKVAILSAIGSDMKVPGILSRAVSALAADNISVLAVHQSLRQVDMQFVLDEADYETAARALHRALIEVHDHGTAICAA